MPSYTYTGEDERVFPHVSLTVAPGDVVELDENPDPRWFSDAEAIARSALITEPVTEMVDNLNPDPEA